MRTEEPVSFSKTNMRAILLSIDNPKNLMNARDINADRKDLLVDPTFWQEWILRHQHPSGDTKVSSNGDIRVPHFDGPYYVLRYNLETSQWEISTYDDVSDVCDLAKTVALSTTFNGGRVRFTFSERMDAWDRLSETKKEQLSRSHLSKQASEVTITQAAAIVEDELDDTNNRWLLSYLTSHLCVVEDRVTPCAAPLTLLKSAFGKLIRPTYDRPLVPV